MFVQRVTGYPAMGKEREARATAEEWVKKRQSKGIRINLAMPMYSADGPALVITSLFNDLAEIEGRMRQNADDKDFQAYAAKMSSLSRQPIKAELAEVLVPFQSSPP